jgi:hypothetical protein
MSHTESNLLSHLLGTWDILMGWELENAICDAGLFHSVYGTEKYEQSCIPLSARDPVRQLIGRSAERIVYIFATVDRLSIYSANWNEGVEITLRDHRDGTAFKVLPSEFYALSHVLLANWIEQRPKFPSDVIEPINRKFIPILPLFEAIALRSFLIPSASRQ